MLEQPEPLIIRLKRAREEAARAFHFACSEGCASTEEWKAAAAGDAAHLAALDEAIALMEADNA